MGTAAHAISLICNSRGVLKGRPKTFFFGGSPDGGLVLISTQWLRTCNACVYVWSHLTMHEKPPRFFVPESLVSQQVRRWCDSQNQKVFNLHSQFLRSLTHARTSFPIATILLHLHNRQKVYISIGPSWHHFTEAMRSLLDSIDSGPKKPTLGINRHS